MKGNLPLCILTTLAVVFAIILIVVAEDEETSAAQTRNQTNSSDDDQSLEGTSQNNSTDDNSTMVDPKSAPAPNLGSSTIGEYCYSAKECNPDQLLTCENKTCVCQFNKQFPTVRLVFGRNAGKCVPLAYQRAPCTDDIQCKESTFGNYSTCNRTSLDTGHCECYDRLGRDLVEAEYGCYFRKKIGEACKTHKECNMTIGGEAICAGANENGTQAGVCSCANKYQFYPEYNECLKLGVINSVCKTDNQCQHEEAMGRLSRCRNSTKTCVCDDPANEKKTAYDYASTRCQFSRGVNESCELKVECELGYHKDAECVSHPSFTDGKICNCPVGRTCKNPASVHLPSFAFLIYILGIYISFN